MLTQFLVDFKVVFHLQLSVLDSYGKNFWWSVRIDMPSKDILLVVMQWPHWWIKSFNLLNLLFKRSIHIHTYKSMIRKFLLVVTSYNIETKHNAWSIKVKLVGNVNLDFHLLIFSKWFLQGRIRCHIAQLMPGSYWTMKTEVVQT